MERGQIGADPRDSTAETSISKVTRKGKMASRPASAPAQEREPGLPFWGVTLLFLGLPVTIAGILLITWMVLFGR